MDPDAALPGYLEGYAPGLEASPRAAGKAWLGDAGVGLHLEYGVYSQLRRGPSVQFDETIPPGRYAALQRTFDPSGFDADSLVRLAVACGLKYVSFTAKDADGFALFRTIETGFNTLASCGRDLVGELAASCGLAEIGLLLSYSYAADWRHPYFFPAESVQTEWRQARPAYEVPPPEYRFASDEDFFHYVRSANNQLQEIAYRYVPIAGIRLEPPAGYFARPDLFPVQQAYELVREAQSRVLIAFGQGVTGDEDFATAAGMLADSPPGGAPGLRAWAANRSKPLEIRQPIGGRDASELADAAAEANDQGANLLLVASLRPDGSLDPSDERALAGMASGDQ